ncbi:MAG: ATP-binding protein [Candidatus Aenigmarchaeota archaeon]|nr:ATP-binding protein [Candidatus Aenigmarchaeota archaeon]
MLVGRIVGRTSPEWFMFEVSGVMKKMDFIATRDPEKHWVLGRIEGITQERDKAIARVSVIGYTDKRGTVRLPKMPFKPGSFVYKADDGLIKKVLGLKSSGLYVGLLDGSENLRVYLDPKLLITKHLAVLAKSGFGKSYFIGVLLEEFMENKIPAVVIDPHGEYTSLRDPNRKPEEIKYMPIFNIKPNGYKKELQIFCLEKNLMVGAKKLKFNGKLNYEEVFEMFPFRLTANQMSVLYSAVQDLGKPEYTLDDLRKQILISSSKAKWSTLSVIDFLKSTGIFDTSSYVKPSDVVKKDMLSIINLKGIEPDVQQLVVYKLVKDLFEARKQNKIPFFLLVIEEAQNFCPERGLGGEAISSDILRTVASEGRKFGMGIAIISQRPARVDKNVLSQCNTQLFLRITNPNDLRSIMDSVEGITRGIESQIKILPIGTCVMVGLIDQPLLVNIRIRKSNHTGAPAMMPERIKEKEEGDILYFYPKFLEEDVKKNIIKKFEQFKLVYYPLWLLRCKFVTEEGEKVDNLFVDGITGELVFLRQNLLTRTDGLPRLLRLNMKDKAVLLYLTTYGMSSFENMMKMLKISEKDLSEILTRLQSQELITKEEKEYESNIDLNFEEIIENQISETPVNYKYAGDVLPFKISMASTDKVLDLFNPEAVERKKCYYPYWLIFYDDGSVDVIDALTGEKDERLMVEDVLDGLSR